MDAGAIHVVEALERVLLQWRQAPVAQTPGLTRGFFRAGRSSLIGARSVVQTAVRVFKGLVRKEERMSATSAVANATPSYSPSTAATVQVSLLKKAMETEKTLVQQVMQSIPQPQSTSGRGGRVDVYA